MPHATLTVQDEGGITVPAQSGGSVYLAKRRVRAWVRVGNEYSVRPAIIDTGAPACILPSRIWTSPPVQSAITWVAGAPDVVPAENLPRIPLLAERHPFRIGRVRLELVDLGDGSLTAREVLAICTEDVPPPSNTNRELLPLIVGLGEGLNGRSLLLQVSEDGRHWSAMLHEA
jgi:hypothetical protein